ncbi:MAG: hypothetical protein E7613_07540 [Ruminococcaceae bacterium]|nr:hypothetical protein [Oscillospiraceae bacterium]
MSEAVIVALLSLAGTALGTFGGIISSQKMVKYRLTKLEEKVDKHNHLVERVTSLELRNKVCEHRIENLESRAG